MCVAAAVAGGAIASSLISSNASGNAAAAQQAGAQGAQATQMAMYNQTASNLHPYNQIGQNASKALAGYYGLPGGVAPAGGYQQMLQNLPGYQFQQQQGNLAVQRNLAASGLLDSGAAGKELQQYGQGLASQYGQTYAAGLAGLAGQGESAAAMQGYSGTQAANQISGAQIYGGNAAAAGQIGGANAINSGLSGLTSSYMYANTQNMQNQSANNAYYQANSPGYQPGGNTYQGMNVDGYIT